MQDIYGNNYSKGFFSYDDLILNTFHVWKSKRNKEKLFPYKGRYFQNNTSSYCTNVNPKHRKVDGSF